MLLKGIENHIKSTNGVKEIQAGLTKGDQIENNLFI